jgi:hypothetical protein
MSPKPRRALIPDRILGVPDWAWLDALVLGVFLLVIFAGR